MQNGQNQLGLRDYVGITAIVAGGLFTQWLALSGRVSNLELELARQVVGAQERTRRLSQVEVRLDQQRIDWLNEIKELRRELVLKYPGVKQ